MTQGLIKTLLTSDQEDKESKSIKIKEEFIQFFFFFSKIAFYVTTAAGFVWT